MRRAWTWHVLMNDAGEGGGGGDAGGAGGGDGQAGGGSAALGGGAGGGDAGQSGGSSGASGAGGGGPEIPAWAQGFESQELQQLVATKQYGDAEALAQAYQHATAKLGKNPDKLLELPDDMSNADAMGAIWTTLGRPEEPGGYQVEVQDEAMAPIADRMKQIVWDAGVSNEGFQKIINGFAELQGGLNGVAEQQSAADFEASISSARSKYGEKFEEVRAAGLAATKQLGWGDEVLDALVGALKPAGLIDFAYQLSMSMGEHSMDFGSEGGQGAGGFKNAAAAKAEWNRLKNDPDWQERMKNGDPTAIAQRDRLIEIFSTDDEASGVEVLR